MSTETDEFCEQTSVKNNEFNVIPRGRYNNKHIPLTIYCYNDNYDYIPVDCSAQIFFRSTKTFNKHLDLPVVIPAKKKFVDIFFEFLIKKIIPLNILDIINLLNISQFCDLVNRQRTYLFTRVFRFLTSGKGVMPDLVLSYFGYKNMSPGTYDAVRYFVENIDDYASYYIIKKRHQMYNYGRNKYDSDYSYFN